jgi:hypothetical protein
MRGPSLADYFSTRAHPFAARPFSFAVRLPRHRYKPMKTTVKPAPAAVLVAMRAYETDQKQNPEQRSDVRARQPTRRFPCRIVPRAQEREERRDQLGHSKSQTRQYF